MIEDIIRCSLMIAGINATTWPTMIFERQADWLIVRLPYWICKPLFECIICMASIWGTIFFLSEISNFDIISYIKFIFAVAGLNTIINGIQSLIRKSWLDV